eukprot:scaffold39271_cov59-Attheya_sp.AAC.1
MAIDRQRIIAAFQLLSVNNERYEELNEALLANEFPEPLIVGSSEEDEDGNDPQEHILKPLYSSLMEMKSRQPPVVMPMQTHLPLRH